MKKLLVVILTCILSGCQIQYGLDIGGPSEDLSTFNVFTFTSNNANVPPTFPQLFTETLKQQILNQSKLTITNVNPDVEFSGMVANYLITPMGIQSGDNAAQNRLTITVKVDFINNVDPKQSYSQTFSQYQDYDATADFATISPELHRTLIELLSIKIFNESFSDW